MIKIYDLCQSFFRKINLKSYCGRWDPDSLAQTLSKVVNMSLDQRKLLGQDALKHVRNNFSIDTIRKQYYSLYRELKINRLPGLR